jgi:serine/threonine protein kinase
MILWCAFIGTKPRRSIVSLTAYMHATAIHSRLNHPNIVSLLGAGTTTKSVRFVVLERLDGGTLSQMLGYDTRIRDRRRRFWRKKQMSYLDILKCARSIADAMAHCHEYAIPGCMVLHRDLKPDNIGEWTRVLYFRMLDIGTIGISCFGSSNWM